MIWRGVPNDTMPKIEDKRMATQSRHDFPCCSDHGIAAGQQHDRIQVSLHRTT